jgi:hypothetical protein
MIYSRWRPAIRLAPRFTHAHFFFWFVILACSLSRLWRRAFLRRFPHGGGTLQAFHYPPPRPSPVVGGMPYGLLLVSLIHSGWQRLAIRVTHWFAGAFRLPEACHTSRSLFGSRFPVGSSLPSESLIGSPMRSGHRRLAIRVAPHFIQAFQSPAASHASLSSCSSCVPVVADLANDSPTYCLSDRAFVSVPRCLILNA